MIHPLYKKRIRIQPDDIKQEFLPQVVCNNANCEVMDKKGNVRTDEFSTTVWAKMVKFFQNEYVDKNVKENWGKRQPCFTPIVVVKGFSRPSDSFT